MERKGSRIRWSLAPSWAQLDPRRFIGTVTELPPTAVPGEWCRVVLVDELGELRWTLVADDVERTASIFLERRPTRPLSDVLGCPSERVAERVGADGSDTIARKTEGGTDQPAAGLVRRRQ